MKHLTGKVILKSRIALLGDWGKIKFLFFYSYSGYTSEYGSGFSKSRPSVS